MGSASAIVAHARSDQGRKQLRYVAVSLVFVPIGQALIQIVGYLLDRRYTLASLMVGAILMLPNFLANRRFVWRLSGRDNLRAQVLVFWIAVMLGVAFATLLTFLAERLTHHESALVEGGAVFAAQAMGIGVVWVGRYLVLDRWLFKLSHGGAEPNQDELAELHGDVPI